MVSNKDTHCSLLGASCLLWSLWRIQFCLRTIWIVFARWK